jgi:hypothetical protein
MSINVCNDRSMASITSLPSGVSGSSLVLLSTQTASSSSTISFTSDIDSTYKEYIFKFIDMHHQQTQIQIYISILMSADSGSYIMLQKLQLLFRASYTDEADSTTTLTYSTGSDLAQYK